MEIFKKSKKSICHGCKNFNDICSFLAHKVCSTDNVVELAYVEKCSSFNSDLVKELKRGKTIKVSAKADSRLEMMGGGH